MAPVRISFALPFVVELALALIFYGGPAYSQLINDPGYIQGRVVVAVGNNQCPSSDLLEAAQLEIGHEVRQHLVNQTSLCGGLNWRRIAYLDMTEGGSQCPQGMTEFSSSGKRLCGRSNDAESFSCASAIFFTGEAEYTKICGRIVGYAFGSPYAFLGYSLFADERSFSIETYYIDGVAVTYGPPGDRQHVWTFAAGKSERPELGDAPEEALCPCNPEVLTENLRIPDFIGQDYFCEAGSVDLDTSGLHGNDPLWDGAGCFTANNACCEFRGPPYFTRTLTNSTSDNLEVRVCGYNNRDASGDTLLDAPGDTLIEYVELYVQ